MNTAELLKFHEGMCERARALMARKNHDYAGQSGDTPFANFARVEAMGVTTTEQGFLVRMVDKLSRLSTFCEAGKLMVSDEGVEDTLIDLVNYSVLVAAYLKSKKPAPDVNGKALEAFRTSVAQQLVEKDFRMPPSLWKATAPPSPPVA